MEPPLKTNLLGVHVTLDFIQFSVYILNKVFCKSEAIVAENGFLISCYTVKNTTFEISPFQGYLRHFRYFPPCNCIAHIALFWKTSAIAWNFHNKHYSKIWKMPIHVASQYATQSKSTFNKHNAELRGTAPGANIPKKVCFY